MDTEAIKNWVVERDAVKRTLNSFWLCFDNYIAEDKDEFIKYFGRLDRNKLKVYLDQTALKMKSYKHWDQSNQDLEYVEIILNIHYADEYIGYYSLQFDLSGESIDDFLIWDYRQWYIYQKLDILYELKAEFEKKVSAEQISDKSTLAAIVEEKINETRRITILGEV